MSFSSATPNVWNSGQKIYFGTAPPSTAADAAAVGPSAVGDWVINTAPVNGSVLAWVCTVAGTTTTAGTWIAMGAGTDIAIFNGPTNASLVTTSFYVSMTGVFNVTSVIETHAVAGTDGGAVTAQIYADASGGAQGSGTAILTAGLNMKTTANTPQTGSVVAGVQLPAGGRLTIVFTGTLTTLSGVVVKVGLQRVS